MLLKCTARLAASLLFLVVAAAPAAGQVTTGTVVGTVKDAQGGVLPGATVILISETRGTKMVPVATNAQGDFVVPNVSPDRYQIEISMAGFKTLTRGGLSVGPGDRIPLQTLTLEVGGATETVNVVDSVPLIQAQSGERSFTINQEQVQALPINNRTNNQGFIALATFAPGVDGTSRLGGGGQNNAMMDGVSTMDTGNNQPILFLNTEAVAEVKVLTSNYQAEYGRSSGLQITAVTKSGTNRFHGSVYDVMRNSDWNTNSWENQKNGRAKTVNKESDWGYTLGGPVGKPGGSNKLFFFFSQEWRAARDERRRPDVPLPDSGRAERRFLADARPERRAVPVHPRRVDRPAVRDDRDGQSRGVLPVPGAARPDRSGAPLPDRPEPAAAVPPAEYFA